MCDECATAAQRFTFSCTILIFCQGHHAQPTRQKSTMHYLAWNNVSFVYPSSDKWLNSLSNNVLWSHLCIFYNSKCIKAAFFALISHFVVCDHLITSSSLLNHVKQKEKFSVTLATSFKRKHSQPFRISLSRFIITQSGYDVFSSANIAGICTIINLAQIQTDKTFKSFQNAII